MLTHTHTQYQESVNLLRTTVIVYNCVKTIIIYRKRQSCKCKVLKRGLHITSWPCRFDYQEGLRGHLERPATVVPVFDRVQMQGEHGAQATVDLPAGVSLPASASSGFLDSVEFAFPQNGPH